MCAGFLLSLCAVVFLCSVVFLCLLSCVGVACVSSLLIVFVVLCCVCCALYCWCYMLLSVRSADRHFVSGELQGAADMDRDLASRIALGPGGSP